jgi:DeoR family galactitol utilization operon repressor
LLFCGPTFENLLSLSYRSFIFLTTSVNSQANQYDHHFNEGYSISGVMAAAAHKVVAVLDASKFNRRGFNQVLPMDKIDCVITDEGISEKDKVALNKMGKDVMIV